MKFSTVLSFTAATLVSFSSAAPLIGALLAPLALDVLGSTGPGKEITGGIKDTTKDILGGVLGDDKESNETQIVENNNDEVASQNDSTDLTQAEGLQANPNDPHISPAVVSDESGDPETTVEDDTSFVDDSQEVPPSTFDRLPSSVQDSAREMNQVN